MRSLSPGTGVLAAAALVAASTVLLAGCSSGGSPAAAPGSSPASASSTAIGPASPTPTVAVSSPPAPGPCQSSALKVTIGNRGAAAGTAYYAIDFTNVSATACTLYGYPGVSFTGETYSVQVGPAATRNPSSPKVLVTLAPGAVASAQISVVDALNFSPGPCGLTTVSGILIYPPNLTTAVGLPFNSYTCVHAKDHILTVNAVIAGPNG